MHSVREKVSTDGLDDLEWRGLPLAFDLVAEILQVSYLRAGIARHIDQSVETLARA